MTPLRVQLANVVSCLESGSRPKGGVAGTTSGVPSLGGEHVSVDGGFRFENVRYVPSDFYESMRTGQVRRGDILIVKDGATTGKTSFVSSDFPYPRAAVNEHVFLVRVAPSMAVPSFVAHFLRSPAGQAGILSDLRGATVGGISRGFVNKVMIPLPPLPEQRRIAAILDQAEALRAKRRQSLARLDALTQSIFEHCVGPSSVGWKCWPEIGLMDICDIEGGTQPPKSEFLYEPMPGFISDAPDQRLRFRQPRRFYFHTRPDEAL